MNEYYARTEDNPTFWHVKDGKRKKVAGIDEMYEIGLLPLKHISEKKLQAIPLAGAKAKPAPKKKGEEGEDR